jgi:hypothetical protein
MTFNSKGTEDTWSRPIQSSIPKFNPNDYENLEDINKGKSLAGSWAV